MEVPQPSPGRAAAAPGPSVRPNARLVSLEPAGLSFAVEIDKSDFSIGRRESNDGVVPVDSSQGVSGQHLRITFVDGKFYVEDEKSTFGTTVNGQPIPKGGPVPLEDGAVIGLGPVVRIKFIVGGG